MNASLAITRKVVITFAAASLVIACDTEKADVKRTTAKPAAISNSVVVTTAAPTNRPPAQPTQPGPLVVSPALNEIIKLAQAGVGEQVLLTYIENSPLSYKPTADEIVYLTDLGVSENVITTLMKGGSPLQERVAGLQQAQPDPAQPAPVPNAPGQPGLVGLSATNPPQGVALAATPQPEPPQQRYIVAQPVAGQPNYVEAPAPAPIVTYATPPAPVSYNYFYETLSPYGSWVDYPGYGYCWQPSVTVIDAGWRPYHNRGRWLYTDSGWYWQSDYSWGWAPFHYGRWVNTHNCGWLWSPDTVWAPAWVSWRHSRDHCGWAPLPPGAAFVAGVGFHYRGARVGVGFTFGLQDEHYTFIRSGRLTDRNPWGHYEPAAKNSSIIKNSTVVNNYIVGNNNTIINGGIDRDRLVAETRQEIRKIPLQEVNRPQGIAQAADRVSKDGSSLAVYRPQVPQQAAKPPAHVPTRTVDQAVRVASFSTRSEAPKMAPAVGGSLQPSKIAPSNLGATTQSPQNRLIPARGSSVVPITVRPASTPATRLAPDRSADLPTRANTTVSGSSVPTAQTPAARPAPAGLASPQTQTPSGNPVGSLQNRNGLQTSRPVAEAPRQGLVRPLENTAAPTGVTPRTLPSVVPSSTQRTLTPAVNGPSAFRPGNPAPPQAAPPASGFRQDFRKIEAPPQASVPPPKFQNNQNTAQQRTFGANPGAYIPPQQNFQQPSGSRGSPAPSYNSPPPASFQNRPAPSGNQAPRSYSAPPQNAPPASRPQPSPGGNSTGGRREEGKKN